MTYIVEYLSRGGVWSEWARVAYPDMAENIAERARSDAWLVKTLGGESDRDSVPGRVRVRQIAEPQYWEAQT